MSNAFMRRAVLFSVALAFSIVGSSASGQSNVLVIPEVKDTPKHLITLDEVMAIRRIDTLSISPDGRRFAIFVRQADPASNEHRTGWFVGSTQGGALTNVGSGGQLRPEGWRQDLVGSESRWSPDGQWIAYTLKHEGEVQLWRSRARGGLQEQITHNDSDVREFGWSEDGRSLYFTVGSPRLGQRISEQSKARNGYEYDEDLVSFNEFMLPAQLMTAAQPSLEAQLPIWVVTLDDGHERVADESERTAFERVQARQAGGVETIAALFRDAAVPPIARADGAITWLERTRPTSSILRVKASLSSTGSNPIVCLADECSGRIRNVWWSDDAHRVLFWRSEGINNSANGFYAWSPTNGAVSVVLRLLDGDLQQCRKLPGDQLICMQETPTSPAHLAVIDLRSAAVQSVADVNPEFRSIRLGRVERFEWNTPKFEWNEPGGQLAGLYPKQAYGYILYPPDFDPKKKYPVFIDPYRARGFERSVGSEHALHVYAASGFVVLNTEFPEPIDVTGRLGANLMEQLYSAKLDFPHLTMLMESTVRALDVVAARGFIDERRVGIGGVSHGTFVPLYMMQKHDRIAAISISSAGWGPQEYYATTRFGREFLATRNGKVGHGDWMLKPEGEGREFWRQIDIADHIDAIEAPILMHLAAYEAYALTRFIRYSADAGKPYDAYVFPGETHLKWQPAHLSAILHRNLDWFRFWLQDDEDPDPAKAEQYSRWHKLKRLHEADRAHVDRTGE